MRVRRKSIGGMSATSAAVQTAVTPGSARAAAGIDRDDAAMRMGGTHHAHMQLMSKRDVGGEAALAGDERPVLKTRQRAADIGHGA